MPKTVDFLKAKVGAYQKVLSQAASRDKEGLVSITLAKQFNSLLDEVKKACPEAEPHIPRPITWESAFSQLAVADVSFLDLEVLVEQVSSILAVVDADH